MILWIGKHDCKPVHGARVLSRNAVFLRQAAPATYGRESKAERNDEVTQTHLLRAALGISLAVVALQGSVMAQVPSDAICVEAEDGMMTDPALVVSDSIFSSAGLRVTIDPAGIGDRRQVEVTRLEIPSEHPGCILWVRCTGVNVGIAKHNGDFAWHNTQTPHWAWHSLGPVAPEEGPLTVAAACPLTPNLGEYAIDCLLFTPDALFQPSGIYRSVVGPGEEAVQDAAPPLEEPAEGVPPVHVTVKADAQGLRVSRYLASANCHLAARHCPALPAWDDTMRRFFAENLLVLLESARREPDENGLWWNFGPIDEFLRKSKEVWQVEELAFLPQWWIQGWDGKSEPAEDQFNRSSEALTQIAERYGRPGPLFVKYWMCCDEWPGQKYWRENPQSFARHYSRLVRNVKAVNPDLLVGGPVDCWPNSVIIEALLRECGELDFIAWNLFVSGRADYPFPQLFERTKELRKQVEASRALSREILGRELPVMVSSYQMNFHAWEPPDLRLAAPVAGVWNALALVYLGQSRAFSGVLYNVRAYDCGMFGPDDKFAVQAGVQSGALPADAVNVRPLARVHDFVNRHIAGNPASTVILDDTNSGIEALATFDGRSGHALVMVNTTETDREVRVTLDPFAAAPYSGFELPVEYLYCDQKTVTSGSGLFFSPEGEAGFHMSAFSAWCLKIPGPIGLPPGTNPKNP